MVAQGEASEKGTKQREEAAQRRGTKKREEALQALIILGLGKPAAE